MATGTPIAIGFYPGSQSHIDERYWNNGVAYTSTAQVLSLIPTISRVLYLTVNVAGVEYWFYPDVLTLVQKVASLSLVDGSVTLAKMANVATSTVFYRKSAGSGLPEVQTLATLKADLGLTGTNSGDQSLTGYVTVVAGSTLLSAAQAALLSNQSGVNTGDETGATIKTKLGITTLSGSNTGDQDLSTLVVKVTGMGLSTNDYTTVEKTKLAGLNQTIFTITLPTGANIAARIAGTIAGTNYPTGWTIAVSGGNPNDLLITHSLGRVIADVKVYSVSGTAITMLNFNGAYSAIVAPDTNSLLIQGLATIALPLVIQLIFA